MNLGEYNLLRADEFTDHGIYLIDSNNKRVLLPSKFIPEGLAVGDDIEVFLYTDSEDRLVATTQKPKLLIGQIGYLKVAGTSKHGAFMEWGLDKDLLLPFKNQRSKIVDGDSYFVTVYVDDFSNRLVATERFGYMFEINPDLNLDTAYKAVVYDEIEVGYKLYVEGPCRGIVYKNELHKPLAIGEELEVYLKNIRPDGKYDFKVERGDGATVEAIAEKIIEKLTQNNGEISITDKSAPEVIAEAFATSKKLFKKAVGNLYRKRKITLLKGKMQLAPKE